LTVENTEIKSCTSHGVQNIGRMWFTDCFIHDNAGAGIIAATAGAVTGGVTLNNCIFYQNGASGVSAYAGGSSTNRAFYFKNCNFSKNTGAGLLFAASSAEFFLIWDCIFDANTTYGIDGGSGGTAAPNVLSQYNNAFFNNTTAARRNMVAGVGDVTLSVSPYTSLGTDFSLNNTAGGGAACRGAGVPGVSPAGTGFIDIGALQHQDAGGATTVYVINQQISRYTEEGQ
jgi:hypothetical protein